MKKMVVVLMLVAVMLLSTMAVSAKETAVLPTFDVSFNGQIVESDYRQFSLIVYKDITYVPMTYFDCRYLGLTTKWDNDTRTLYIGQENITCAYRDYKWENKNEKVNAVEICDFNIVVNGKEIDNSKEPYPLIIFRDVTYFPLTWRFAVDEFGWEYSYDHENGLVINSNNYHVEKLELPQTSDTNQICMIMNDDYYHYAGNDGIYRAKIEDISDYQLLHTMKFNPFYELNRGDNIRFFEIGGDVFFSYWWGHHRADSEVIKIDVDGNITETEHGNYFTPGQNYYKTNYLTKDVSYFVEWIGSGYRHKYYKDGEWIEVIIDGVKLKNVKKDGFLGTRVYIEGYNSTDTKKDRIDIYCVDTQSGEIEKVIENIESDRAFKAIYSWDSKSQQMIDTLFFETEGKVMRCRHAAGELHDLSIGSSIFRLSENNTEVIEITDGNPMFFAMKDNDDNLLTIYEADAYASGSRTGVTRFTCFDGDAIAVGDKMIVEAGIDNPETDIHTAVITAYNWEMPFQTSDVMYYYYINGDTLYYSILTDNAPNGVYKVNLAQYRNY